MINKQQSLPPESVIHVNISKISASSMNSSFLSKNNKYEKPKSETIVVKNTDRISTMYDSLNLKNYNAKFIFNRQILCPNLSFAFYNIHNKDTIVVILSPITNIGSIQNILPDFALKNQENHQIVVAAPLPLPISHKRTLFYSNSSGRFRNCGHNNKNLINSNLNGKHSSKSTDQQLNYQSSIITSNSDSFKNFPSKYNGITTSLPTSKRFISPTPAPHFVSPSEVEDIPRFVQADKSSSDYLEEVKID